MQFDMISAIELTLSAGIVLTTLALGLAETSRARTAFILAGGAWFLLVVVLGATAALSAQGGLGVAGLGVAVLLPIVTLSAAAGLVPAFRRALDRVPLALLIGVNAVRVLGVSFVLLYAADRLPAPFAPVAGWGDVAIGLAALPLAWSVARNGQRASALVLVWNALGLLDLATAVALGAVSSPGPIRLFYGTTDSSLMTSLPWLIIPGFLVPLLATTHLAVFYRYLRDRQAGEGTAGCRAAWAKAAP
jgi:hypothetical protein